MNKLRVMYRVCNLEIAKQNINCKVYLARYEIVIFFKC